MTEYSTTAKGNNTIEREPISEGLHAAKCVGVFGIGIHFNSYNNKNQPQLVITWAVAETYIDDKKQEQNKTISRFYHLTLGKKANLRKDLEKWRGKDFTEQELEGFEVSKVLGAACLLDISNVEKDGNIRDRVDAVRAIDKKYKDEVPNIPTMKEVPAWIEKIRGDSVLLEGEPTSQQATSQQAAPEAMETEEYSDDLPF